MPRGEAARPPTSPGPLPGVLEAVELARFVHVSFRRAERFEEIKSPSWARRVAARYVRGAVVRVGKLKSGAWRVQAVLVPRDFSRDLQDHVDAAWRIMARIETH